MGGRPEVPTQALRGSTYRRRAAAIALGAALLNACGPEAGERESATPTWAVAESTLLALGQVDGLSAVSFSRIGGVRLLDGGGVAVADGASNEIRIFEPSGAVRIVVGRAGEGPGEFQYINHLAYHPPDTLAVFDSGAGRLTLIRTDGSLLESTTFRREDGLVELYLGRASDGAYVLSWIRQIASRDLSSASQDRMAIGLFGPDGALRGVLSEEVGMRRRGPGPVPFSPHFLGGVSNDVVLHADGAAPEIRRTSVSGEPRPALLVELPRQTLSDAWAELRPHVDSAAASSFDEISATPGVDSIPRFSDLFVDADDRIWVKEYAPGLDSHWRLRRRTGGTWAVFEADGTPVARMHVPDGFRLMDVRGDQAAGIRFDELDVEYVEVREIRR